MECEDGRGSFGRGPSELRSTVMMKGRNRVREARKGFSSARQEPQDLRAHLLPMPRADRQIGGVNWYSDGDHGHHAQNSYDW
jgi:hypothetical protein